MSSIESPVVVTAYFYPRPAAREQVLAALDPVITAVHEEDGCELYAIHDAPDGSIVMLEKWTSAALLDAHGQGEPVRRLQAALDGLLERSTEVTRLVPLPIGQADKGPFDRQDNRHSRAGPPPAIGGCADQGKVIHRSVSRQE